MDQPAIAIKGLTRRFGRRTAVDGLTFDVPAGGVCGFLGRNGSGKSTTIRMLMNLVTPSSGSARLAGLDCRSAHTALMQRVGYVDESPALYEWMKVREAVRFTGRFYQRWNEGKVERLLERFGIDGGQKVRHLSRGMYAQLALALALGHDPQLLILDEPATGLDVLVRRDFLEGIIALIQQEGRTVLFSSHLVHEVERVADQVAIIEDGRLVISARIDDLKQETRRLVVRRRDGAERAMTVRGHDGRARRAIEESGGEVVDEMGMSLEEIFVDLVGAGRREEVA